nr:metalloregulator ArsR/SmtB family transcription factor [Alienimonas chondri]
MLATAVAHTVASPRSAPSASSVNNSVNVTGRAGLAAKSDDVLDDDFGAGLAEALDADADSEHDGRFPVLPDALEQDLVQVFKLLSDETRLRILLYLAREGELHVTALCKRLSQSQPAVSHHLALLRNAGIIEPRRDGKHNFYSIRQQRFVGLIAEFFASVRDPETDAVEFDEFVLSKTE